MWKLLRCDSCGDSLETCQPVGSVCTLCGRGHLVPCGKSIQDIIVSFANARQISIDGVDEYVSAARRQREFVKEAYLWYVENLATRINVYYDDGSVFTRVLWDSPEARDRHDALTSMEVRLTAEIHRVLATVDEE